MPTRQVNERQRDILKWIAEGCPERNWPDESHKHSARALASRGLVRVSRSSGRWTAVLTDDGEHFHLHGEYPDGHRFGPRPPEPEPPATPVAEPERPRKRGRSGAIAAEPVNDWAIDSPSRLKERRKGALVGASGETPPHPCENKVLISVKEAAWLLSVSEGMIRGGRSGWRHRPRLYWRRDDPLPDRPRLAACLGQQPADRARQVAVVNDGPEPRWEEPIVRPLYVTLRRAAELLDVPYWQMHGLAFVLETRYFGEKGGAPRVLLTSIDEFIRLRDEGGDARAILAKRKDFRGWSPYPSRPVWQPPAPDPRSRRWRRNWYSR